ncbi:MAG: hypothetical protein OCD01_18025 [Fibrobacterales bacterium]
MLDQESKDLLLNYLSMVRSEYEFKTAEDINKLSASDLLRILNEVNDDALPFFVNLIKEADSKGSLFQKLMGEHQEDNVALSETFFKRYMGMVMQDESALTDFNALIYYLPEETFGDLAFIQSRHSFFMHQTIGDINNFLTAHFNLDELFEVGEEDRAWDYFWSQLLK